MLFYYFQQELEMGANNMGDLAKEKVAMSDEKKSENSTSLEKEV